MRDLIEKGAEMMQESGGAANKQVIVIGAGPAGIYATHSLKKRGVDVMCYEATDHIAGRAYAYRKDGYLCEVGAVGQEPQWSVMGELIEETGYDDSVAPARMRYGFYRKGKWSYMGMGSVKDQAKWLSDTLKFMVRYGSVGLGFVKFALAVKSDLARVSPERAAVNDYSELEVLGDMSIYEYAMKHGNRKVNDYILQPLVSQMVCCKTSEASITHLLCLLFEFIGGAKQDDAAPGGIAVVPKNGIMDIYKRIYDLEPELYQLSSPVKRVIIEEGEAKGVELASGEVVRADHVLCTVPAFNIPDIFEEVPPAAAKMIDSVKYSRCYSIMIGDKRDFVPDALFGICLVNEDSILGAGMCSSWVTGCQTPGGEGKLVHFWTSDKYHDELVAMTDEARRARILKEVKRFLPDLPADPELFEVVRHDHAICRDAPGQMAAVDEYLKNGYEEIPRLTLAGEYMYPIASTEGAMHSAKRAVEHIMEKMGA